MSKKGGSPEHGYSYSVPLDAGLKMRDGCNSIESAPRDGTWVLLKGGVVDAESYESEGIDNLPPAVVAHWSAPQDCWIYARLDGAWRGEYNNPTHWRPLP